MDDWSRAPRDVREDNELLPFAKWVLRSLFSTESRGWSRDGMTTYKDTASVASAASGFIPNPERELVLREEALDLQELIAQVRHDVPRGDKRRLFELALEEDVTDPGEQAKALGVTLPQAWKLRHRLALDIHRAARKLRLDTLVEEEVLASFAPLHPEPRRVVGFTLRWLLGIVTGGPRFANEVALVEAAARHLHDEDDAPPSSAASC